MSEIQGFFSNVENDVIIAGAICALLWLHPAAGAACTVAVAVGYLIVKNPQFFSDLADTLVHTIADTFDYLRNNMLAVTNSICSNEVANVVCNGLVNAGNTIKDVAIGAANTVVNAPHTLGEWISGFGLSYSKITGGSNVTMLLTDPSGRRLGASLDGGTFSEYSEIPDGLYSGNQSDPQIFVIHEPIRGVYKLHLAVRESGAFHLTFQLIQNWNVVNSTNLLKTLQTGAYDYQLTYGAVGNSCCLFIGEPTSGLPVWFWPLMVAVAAIGSGLAVGLIMRRRQRPSQAVAKP